MANEDITKTGIKGLRYSGDEYLDFNDTPESSDEVQEVRPLGIREQLTQNQVNHFANEEVHTDRLDFGTTRFDRRIVTPGLVNEVDEYRAQDQSEFNKVLSGVAKMGVLAGTTFLDGIVGTPAALLSMIGYAAMHGSDEDFSWSGLMSAGVHNILTESLQKINEKSEDWFRNYYTNYEQQNRNNGQWYKNIWSGNFIGDQFIKNMGFTIGAIYSGKATAGLMTKAMGLDEVRKMFKGAAFTSAKTGEALKTSQAIANAVADGDILMNGEKITQALIDGAKKLESAQWGLRLAGSATAAIGEARIEAVTNSNDWAKAYEGKIESQYQEKLQNLENSMFDDDSDKKWFTQGLSFDDDGKVGYTRELTEEGKLELSRRLQQLNAEKSQKLAELNKNKATMANADFLMNIPLLMASDLIQFGKFMSGGYNTGKFARAITKADKFDVKRGLRATGYAKAALSPLSEANEEMMQNVFNVAAGYRASSGLTDMYGDTLDEEANAKGRTMVNAFVNAMDDSYLSAEGLENGFSGLLMGIVGVPGFHMKTTASGKKILVPHLNSGFIEGIKEANEDYNGARELADALNARVDSPEFQNYYKGWVRRRKIQNDLDYFLEKGDEFNFKNAESKQFVSDAIMFAKAGRLNDLRDMIASMANLSDEDIAEIRQNTIDETTGKSMYDGLSNDEVREKIQSNVQQYSQRLSKFAEISENLKKLYGEDIDNDMLEEITWQMTQIDDWETRAQDLHKSISDIIGDKISEIEERVGETIPFLHQNYSQLIESITKDNAKLLREIYSISQNENLSVAQQRRAIHAKIAEAEHQKKVVGAKFASQISAIRRNSRKNIAKLERQRQRFTSEAQRLSNLNDQRNALLEEYGKLKEKIETLTPKSTRKTHRINRQLEAATRDLDILREKILQITDKAGVEDIQQRMDAVVEMISTDMLTSLKGKVHSNSQAYQENQARREYEENKSSILSQIAMLSRRLSDGDMQFISPMDMDKLQSQLDDFIKILAARSSFIENYYNLTEHPEQFTAEAQAKINDIREKVEKQETDAAIAKLDSIDNFRDFIEEYNKYEDIKEALDKAIAERGSERTKGFLNDYNRLADARQILINIIGDKKSPEATMFKARIEEAFKQMESYDDFIARIGDTDGLEKSMADYISARMDEFNDYMSSAETKRKDTKKPKTKPEPARGEETTPEGKFFDDLSDEITEDDEEEGEDSDDEKDDSEEPAETPTPKKPDEPPTPPTPPAPAPAIKPEDTVKPVETPAETPSEASEVEDGAVIPEEDSGAEREPEFDYEAIASGLDTYTTEQLEQYAAGNIENADELGKEKVDIIKQIAKVLLVKRKASAGEASTAEPENTATPEEKPSDEREETLRGDVQYSGVSETEYDYNVLRMSHKAVRRKNGIVTKLSQEGAYEYVGKGMLADRLAKDPNTRLVVLYVQGSTPFSKLPVLAIEIGSDDPSIKTVTGNDGKKYQIVGTLKKGSTSASREQYELIRKRLAREYSSAPKSGEYVVSSIKMQVTGFGDGKFVKSTETISEGKHDVTQSFFGDRQPVIGIVMDDSLNMEFSDIPGPMMPLNPNNKNSRAGSVWIYTKSASGQWFPRSVRVKRFTHSEWDIDSHKETPIYQKIERLVRTILDPKSTDGERNTAKGVLANILVMDSYPILFHKKGDSVNLSIGNYQNNINDTSKTLDEQVADVINQMMAEEIGYRFQVSKYNIQDIDSLNELLDSEVIYTDLALPYNVAGDFTVVVDDGSGNIELDNSKGRGLGVNPALHTITIATSDNSYSITEAGAVTDKDGNPVTDQNVLSEVNLRRQIIEKTIDPIEGNDNLYLGHYMDGTPFGISRGKVITGDSLNKMLNNAKELADKAKAKEKRAEETKNASVPSGSFFSDLSSEVTSDDEADEINEISETPETPVETEPTVTNTPTGEHKEITVASIGRKVENSDLDMSIKIAGRNRRLIKDAGFTGVQGLIEHIKTYNESHTKKIPGIEMVKDAESLQALLDIIKNCR